MSTALDLFDLSVAAGSDLSAKQHHIVKRTAGQLAVCSVSGEQAFGVLQDDPGAAGRAGVVRLGGLSKVYYGGVVSQDDLLITNASGRAIAESGVGGHIIGIANKAGVSGDIGEVILFGPGASGVGYGKGTIQIPLTGAIEADGTALADFSDGASPTPGWSAGDQSVGVRWNNHANPDPISLGFTMPQDIDLANDITLNILAAKIGATLADAVTWTVEAFNNVDAALYDADADFGGVSSAMTGDAATKTTQLESLALAAADLAAAGSQVVLTIQPTDGTLGTDDVILLGLYATYVRK